MYHIKWSGDTEWKKSSCVDLSSEYAKCDLNIGVTSKCENKIGNEQNRHTKVCE